MKKLFFLILVVLPFAFLACTKANDANAGSKPMNSSLDIAKFQADIKKQVNKNKSPEDKGEVDIEAKVITKLENVSGFYLVEVIFKKDGQEVGKQNLLTNGNVITEDFLSLPNFESISKSLVAMNAKPLEIDYDNFTLVHGKKGAKNVLLEVTDFQCPFCKKANKFIEGLVKKDSDVAVYIAHLPLDMHPNAQVMARIYEAGKSVGDEFSHDLFSSDYIKDLESMIEKARKGKKDFKQEDFEKIREELDNKIIEDFAKKSKDAAKFKELVNSEEIKAKVKRTTEFALSNNISSTPTIYVNGKPVTGFNEEMIKKLMK